MPALLQQRASVAPVPHDPAWARRYARERDRLAALLGDRARGIEHIGSTAVPGLAATPIVDVMVTVADAEAAADWLPALEAAGYTLGVREPGHRVLRSADRCVQVHVWSDGDPAAHRHLDLRDRLRRSPGLREDYEAPARARSTARSA